MTDSRLWLNSLMTGLAVEARDLNLECIVYKVTWQRREAWEGNDGLISN